MHDTVLRFLTLVMLEGTVMVEFWQTQPSVSLHVEQGSENLSPLFSFISCFEYALSSNN